MDDLGVALFQETPMKIRHFACRFVISVTSVLVVIYPLAI